MVIIVVREVKSAIVIVVIHILIDHNHRVPSAEEGVCDDGSKGRAADYIATVEVTAIDTIVEVVGHTMIVDRSDVVRDMHIAVIVVVIRVYVRSVRHSMSVRAVIFRMTSRSRLAATGIAVTSIARTTNRLRLCLSLCGISTFFRSGGSGGRRGHSGGTGFNHISARFDRSVRVHVLSCRRIRCGA